jgi:hypothetical protein
MPFWKFGNKPPTVERAVLVMPPELLQDYAPEAKVRLSEGGSALDLRLAIQKLFSYPSPAELVRLVREGRCAHVAPQATERTLGASGALYSAMRSWEGEGYTPERVRELGAWCLRSQGTDPQDAGYLVILGSPADLPSTTFKLTI